MSQDIAVTVHVSIRDDADPDEVGEAVFNFLASDPDDLFPTIEAVDFYDVARAS